VAEIADDVRIEPARMGFIAQSPRWRVAATGQTAEEAVGRLAEVILLSQELDRRVAEATESPSAS
jgi:hypothetical protein